MRFLILAILVAATLCGCKQQTIIGTWEQSGMVARKVTFNEDGTFSVTGDGMASAVALEGTYTIDKNRVTIKGLQAKSNIPFMPMGEAKVPGGEEIKGTYSFKNDQTLTLQGTLILDGSYTRVPN